MMTDHFDFGQREFFTFCGAAQLADVDLVVKRHRHHDRVEQMITIGAPADDAQAQVDLCRRSNLHTPLGNIAEVELRRNALQ